MGHWRFAFFVPFEKQTQLTLSREPSAQALGAPAGSNLQIIELGPLASCSSGAAAASAAQSHNPNPSLSPKPGRARARQA